MSKSKLGLAKGRTTNLRHKRLPLFTPKFILTIRYVANQFLKRIYLALFSALPAFRGYMVAYSNRGYSIIVRFFLHLFRIVARQTYTV
jgi:hypothetical protein